MMKKAYNYLKKNIDSDMPLAEMLEVFRRMSRISVNCDDDTFIMESSMKVLPLRKKTSRTISLIRQIPNPKGEYYRLHLDITFDATGKRMRVTDPIWSDVVEGDFFSMVEKSESYIQALGEKILTAKVSLVKT
jgi:hypothetical protein